MSGGGGGDALPVPPIAGVGASAGGVEALGTLFEALPDALGIAFVVIVHRSAERESALPGILAARTAMPVATLGGWTALEADRVYLVPPGHRPEIEAGRIRASAIGDADVARAPIDAGFRALALTHGDGFALVLSGAGSDGAIGVRAIKDAGGLVLVQDPGDAAFDSMPHAAIATGLADLVLPAAELAARLAELAASKLRARARIGRRTDAALSAGDEAELARILAHLRARTGRDFSRYKRATVLRRVLRRMQVSRVDTLAGYRERLRADAAEPGALLDDLLITVTTFFRDVESWEPLVARVLPALAERDDGEALRVWVAGCATGEEAYSLAMLLIEEAERRERRPEIQLFATDLDEAALATARAGRYPATIAADVAPERLARFFVADGDHYRVSPAVRERVLFTRHDLLEDPPFTRLDLVSCRNLLIYLEREAQQQVFDVFRYALRPGGHLFLGVAESVEGERFEPVDAARRLYRAAPSPEVPRLPELMVAGTGPSLAPPAVPAASAERPSRPDVDVRLLAPPSVLVDASANALQLLDGAGRYLIVPDGAPTSELLAMARPELRTGLRDALERAFGGGVATLAPPVSVAIGPENVDVSIWVRPRRGPDGGRRALAVFVEHPEVRLLFEAGTSGGETGRDGDGTGVDDGRGDAGTGAAADVRRERHLRDELRLAEARLRTSDEDHRAALGAVRSANEELQSVNEEYRSTAEELETSKEELQSINEELESVNAELKGKLAEVSRAHDDLENLMAATDIGTLFLDRELKIQRFTPSLAELFNVRPGDRGRDVGDLTHRLDHDDLAGDARRVLETLVPFERETAHEDGRAFVVRMRPYRTAEHRIDGVVLTFVDVSGMRRARLALDWSERRFEALLQSMPDVAFAADRTGTLAWVGERVAESAGVDPDALVGRALWAEIVHPDDRDHAEAAWREAIATDAPYEMRFRQRAADGAGHRWVIARAVAAPGASVPDAAGPVPGTGSGPVADRVGTITDVDELTRAEQALREADRHRNRFLGLLGHELRNPLAALGNSLQVLDGIDPAALDAAGRGVPVAATLATLGRQGRHMSRLVDDLLDLTRISNGKIALRTRRMDLAECVSRVLETVRPRAAAAGLALAERLPEGPLWLDADPERLDQLLGNLLDNAVKYSDPGGTIELAVERDGAEVRVRVTDTGIGIPAGALPTLFEPFTQAVGPERVGRGGLGLGLALVRSLAALHGGTIEAASDGEGRGSEFTLRLPSAPQRNESRRARARAGTVPDRPRRILVVDDSSDVAEPFATLLRTLGHEVEVALDGPAALELVAARAPEVAFLDLGMPGMDGLELARRLRRGHAPGALRLVAVTGFGQAEDVAAARAAGFDEHLLKPVRLATVRALLAGLG